MDTIKTSASFHRSLRYVEWIFISVFVFTCVIEGAYKLNIAVQVVFFAHLISYFILSYFFPIHSSVWQRIGYIALGLFLSLSIRFTGTDLNLFLYFYIGKSCFLLDKKYIVPTVIVTGYFNIMTFIWTLPITIHTNPPWQLDLYNKEQVQQAILQHLTNYLVVVAFTIAFSFMVVNEQKIRQRTEALAQEVETLAALHERTRIARDMHDSLGHTLTNLQVQLVVAQKFSQNDIEKTLIAVNIAKLLADQCIKDVSHALQTMRQTEFNINQALNSLLEQSKHRQALKIRWKLDLPQIPLHQSYQIYCIVKEGLINIQKHAKASKVNLQAYTTGDTIIIELQDNGVGFNKNIQHTGLGLKGMSERAFMLGAKLEIAASPTGTHIKVKIPL
ncbi:hypothetical protein NIES2101_42360 [Calothrix sp. HK-06]|nr:hypothetical protein NIES2101_42360 [Calothrix sp. HK-06]